MFPNRFALIALGVTCVAAAAGGGYLATRHNAAVQPAAAATPAATATEVDPGAKPAVHETEAVVAEARRVAPKPASSRANVVTERRAPASARNTPTPPARRTEGPRRTPERSGSAWPISTPPASQANVGNVQPPVEQPVPQAPLDTTVVETPRAAEPPKEPQKVFEELVVSANSVIGLELDGAISSDRAEVEDRVEARVVRDVRVGSDVAIPAGARALGSVMTVERGGKFKDRARLGIRFHTLVLADGTRLPITSETIYRSGDAPGNASAAKIGGGAVAGAILGAIIGGAKGAAVGATAGAGGGTAAVMAGDAKAATFPSGTEVTARILSPVTVTVER
jgi:hypothetical protein